MSLILNRTYKKEICSSVFVSLVVLFTVNLTSAADEISAKQVILPSGTRMVVPQFIMNEYKKDEAQRWGGDPAYFLFHHYAYSGLSRMTGLEGKDTSYLPLSREDSQEMRQSSDIILVDILNMQMVDAEKGVFITKEDMNIHDIGIHVSNITKIYEYFNRIGLTSVAQK